MPYGFPSGEQLISNIIRALTEIIRSYDEFQDIYVQHDRMSTHYQRQLETYPHLDPKGNHQLPHTGSRPQLAPAKNNWEKLFRILHENGIDKTTMVEFKTSLYHGQPPSIDRFIETHRDFLKIGKLMIVHIILGCEDPLRNHKFNDWYSKLWKTIHTNNLQDLKRNQLKIITFNYDRSLEHYFLKTIKNYYRIPEEEAYTYVEHFDFIHLHGSLGHILASNKNHVEMHTDHSPKKFSEIADGVNIIFEKDGNEPVFRRAQELIHEWAENVFVMGFGYDKVNIDRLKLNSIKKLVHGTCYLQSAQKKLTLKTYLRNFSFIDSTCAKFVDSHIPVEL